MRFSGLDGAKEEKNEELKSGWKAREGREEKTKKDKFGISIRRGAP